MGMRYTVGWVIAGVALFGLSLSAWADKPFPESDVHPRLTTSLQELGMRASGELAPTSDLPGEQGISTERVTVIIEPESGQVTHVDKTGIQFLGGRIEGQSKSLLEVTIPADRLLDLADTVDGIAFIREPLEPRTMATSQGVSVTEASGFHAAGYEGQGADVAIIDLGFIGLAASQAAGELNNVVYTEDFTGGGMESSTDHGVQVAETVADMAPAASLHLLNIDNSVDLQNAVQYCIENGIVIVNHSVGWYNSNYYDGTGVIASIANDARAEGILWINSAGNEADDAHWQGDFLDTDGDSYHDFGSGSDYLDGSDAGNRDEGSRVTIPADRTLTIYMTWDAWTVTDQDFDLYLYNSSGTEVASSENWQSGFQAPVESLSYTSASTDTYEIVIHAYEAAAPYPEIEFFAFLDSGSVNHEDLDSSSTIVAPANSGDVVAVGAMSWFWYETGPVESFSSRGPSNASQYSASRTKPDITGPDGTSTSLGNFFGTSSSSPHTAGAAALLYSEDPSRTADDLEALLVSSAIDMGSAGKDNVYGAGRLNLELTPAGDEAAYWDFEDGPGSTLRDQSTNSNDGTIYGATWATSADGSGALSFDGVNDYVRVTERASLDITGALTIEAWVKLDAGYNQVGFVVAKRDGLSRQYGLSVREDRYVRIHTWNAPNAIESSSQLATGQWVHIASVIDGTTARIYIDGVLDATGPVGALGSEAGDVVLGALDDGGTMENLFAGTIDEVRIHDQALSAGELTLLPGGGPPAATPPAQVTDFAATDDEDGQSSLSWTNPSDADLAQVVVQRKTGSYPTDHTDGTTVYDNGSPTPSGTVNTTNTGLTNGTTYYYAVFGRDARDWNDTVTNGNNADTGAPSDGGTPPPPSDEAAYWDFEDAPDLTLRDQSANSNDGTIYGASWATSADGSGALSFDGVNDYVRVPESTSLDITGALTIEAWVKLDAGYDELGLVVAKRDGTSAHYGLSIRDTRKVRIHGWTKPIQALESSSVLPTDTWVHIAGVINGSTASIYIDGVLDATGPITPIISVSCDVFLGALEDHGTQAKHFAGTIDEVRIHDQALSAGELTLLPGGGPPAATPPAQVTDFAATDDEDGQSSLSWTNPSDADLAQVVVQRKTGSYPTDHTDGTTVYDNGSPTPSGTVNTTNTGLTNGTTYYYAVFGRDARDWNETVTNGNNADTGAPSDGGTPPPPSDEAAYWDFEDAPESTLRDQSANSNDGTIYGASWATSADGSGALSFDGVNDYVRVPEHASLDITTTITIEAWVKLDPEYDQVGFVVAKRDGIARQYGLSIREDRYIRIHGWTSPMQALESETALTTGTWVHIAGVIDGATAAIYINGALDATGAVTPITDASCDIYLGAIGYGASRKNLFDGVIDEVRIHDKAIAPGAFTLLAPDVEPLAIDSQSGESIQYWAWPIPTRGEAVTFSVSGLDAVSIRYVVYDLSGQILASADWTAGDTTAWDLLDDYGRRVANGAYICRIHTKDQSGWIHVGPWTKLFVLQ